MARGKCLYAGCGETKAIEHGRCFMHEDRKTYPDAPAPEHRPKIAPRQKKPAPLPPPPPPRTLADVFKAALDLSERRAGKLELPIPTGWRQLDEIMGGGFWPGLHVVVAASGVGKTQFALQVAGGALARGTPCAMAELELEEEQIGLRLLASHTPSKLGISWSSAYLGTANEFAMNQLRDAAERLGSAPLYLDVADGMGAWSISRLEGMAVALRQRHPEGPGMLVLDFLQLVGAGEGQERLELRERIAAATYAAKSISKRYKLAVIVVSSTGRANYAQLAPEMRKTGLRVRGKKRIVLDTQNWIGMGKESGEIEFSADSLLVLFRPTMKAGDGDDDAVQTVLERGGYPVVGVVPKLRYGQPGWFAMPFELGRLGEWPVEATVNSLAPPDSSAFAVDGDSAPSTRDECVATVVATIRMACLRGTPIKGTTNALEEMLRDGIPGRRPHRQAAINAAMSAFLIKRLDGFWALVETAKHDET